MSCIDNSRNSIFMNSTHAIAHPHSHEIVTIIIFHTYMYLCDTTTCTYYIQSLDFFGKMCVYILQFASYKY